MTINTLTRLFRIVCIIVACGLIPLLHTSSSRAQPAGAAAPSTDIVVRLSSSARPEDRSDLEKSLKPRSVTKLSVKGTELWRIPSSKLSQAVVAGSNNPAVDYIEHPKGPLDRFFMSVPRSSLDDSQRAAITRVTADTTQVPVNVTRLDAAAFKSDQLADGDHPIRLEVTPGMQSEFLPRRVIRNEDGSFTWVGGLKPSQSANRRGGVTFTVTQDNKISGQVLIGNDVFNYIPLGSNAYLITRIDPSTQWKDEPPAFADVQRRSPPEAPIALPTPAPSSSSLEGSRATARADIIPTLTLLPTRGVPTQGDLQSNPVLPVAKRLPAADVATTGQFGPICTQTGPLPVTIGVLVLYTRAVAHGLITPVNLTAATDFVQRLIADTNVNVYPNSQIPLQLTLRATRQLNFYEGQTYKQDTDILTFSTEVAALRRQSRADLVVLLVDKKLYPYPENQYCGWSKMINADPQDAFSLIDYQCAPAPNYSFVHEIGHLEGARHDPCTDGYSLPFAYGHGYIFVDYSYVTNGWRTL
jgi:Metallo-peptidase family M12